VLEQLLADRGVRGAVEGKLLMQPLRAPAVSYYGRLTGGGSTGSLLGENTEHLQNAPGTDRAAWILAVADPIAAVHAKVIVSAGHQRRGDFLVAAYDALALP